MTEETASPGDTASTSADRRHQLLIVAISIGVGALLLLAAYLYWEYDFGHPTSDDASVQANVVWVTPQVSGAVVKLYIKDNQLVNAGDPLFDIDDRPYAATLNSAKNELALVKQSLEVDQASLEAARALVEEQEAAVNLATDRYERTRKLVAKGNASEFEGVEDRDAMLEAQALLKDYKAQVDIAAAKLGSLTEQQARIDKAEATVALAQLDQDWTKVTAPADGYVTNFILRVGQRVTPDSAVFPLVESDVWWVRANYKETEIAGIRVGQKAEVSVDSYSGKTFTGTVESISSASAASFSLLPPQNTTGNWVKVSQRIPVRIRLDAVEQMKYPLRVGVSASVTVDIDSTL